MNDMTDIFIYTEGRERVAYQAGQEIARMSPMGYERFIVSLFQWMRQHGVRPIWAVDEKGEMTAADEFQKEVAARLAS